MKAIVAVALLVTVVGSVSSAAVEKICFGSGEEKGGRFGLVLGTNKITVTGVNKTQIIEAGSYKVTGTVNGKDGNTYMDATLEYVDGGVTHLLVDSKLANAGTKGLAKIRGQGEGFFEYAFVCRDSNQN